MRSIRIAGIVLGAACAACSAQTYYTLTDLGSLTSPGESWAFDVNESGTAAGFSLLNLPRRLMTGVRMEDGQVKDLGRFQSGSWAWAWAINDNGHVAGTAHGITANGPGTWAYRHNGVSLQLLDKLPGGYTTAAFGINSSSVIVGRADPGGALVNTITAVRWNGARITKLASLGGFNSYARAINDTDEIVGGSELMNGPIHACIWREGAPSDLGTLGGRGSDAYDINDAGQVVGWAHMADGTERGFLWQDGSMSDIGTLGTSSQARAINEASWIVGTSWVAGEGRRAFVRAADGRMLNLNHRVRSAPGWTLQFATGINDSGVIVGYGRSEGRSRAFLLTPVCDADFNGDGIVNSGDVMEYLNTWTAREPGADFDGDGAIDTRDVVAFLNAWAAGC